MTRNVSIIETFFSSAIRRLITRADGSALVMAIMLSMVILLLCLAGGKLLETSSRETNINKNVLAEADNVARAGLVDAISWFRRQSVQPVAAGYPLRGGAYADQAFYPRYSTAASSCDTIDESIGLVKEYRMSDDSNKWARYEIVRQQDTSTADPHAVHDVTAQRMEGYYAGQGLVWYIESTGYVFQKNDPSKAFNVTPNRVISQVRASTEIRRMSFSLPAEAAFMIFSGNNSSYVPLVNVYQNGRITGGSGIGAGRKQGKKPNVYSGGIITGTPDTVSNLSEPTLESILGMTATELKLLADYIVTDTAELPAELPNMSLIYVDGNAVFSSTRPLTGNGFLYVNGNLTVSAGSNSVFSG
ncbi:MAG: hypothetical protein PHW69_01270, partial [Elusimicrobiaceae bacterium]|nr:hypothetical protein [Elusimicrobiaceae bacterium]